MDFCNKLRILIEEKSITQKQVANDLNIAPSTMGGYVQGSSEPDFDTLKKLAKYFNVTTDYLLSVNTERSSSPFDEELLRIFHAMTLEHQAIFLDLGKAFVKANTKK